jgi:hypothetical protein
MIFLRIYSLDWVVLIATYLSGPSFLMRQLMTPQIIACSKTVSHHKSLKQTLNWTNGPKRDGAPAHFMCVFQIMLTFFCVVPDRPWSANSPAPFFLGQAVSSDLMRPERVLSCFRTSFMGNATSWPLCKVFQSTLPKFVVNFNSLSISIYEERFRYYSYFSSYLITFLFLNKSVQESLFIWRTFYKNPFWILIWTG